MSNRALHDSAPGNMDLVPRRFRRGGGEMRYRHGIAVMRAQPLHFGHCLIIDQMLQNCQNVTILLGSCTESGTDKNPFTYLERRIMLRNVYGKQFNIMGIEDIGRPDLWGKYVMGTVVSRYPLLPVPDAYYSGSAQDAALLMDLGVNLEIVGRDYLTGTNVRAMIKAFGADWKQHTPKENHTLIANHIDKRIIKDAKT